ncbi:hypothetical protein IAD21_00517 [Abditibacteriota bacterium]|nr:hypothetical protein IAD21_00517 [Abditibacteriota bacterium]
MQPQPKHYLCFRAPSTPSIDGSLESKAWDAAPWTDEFVDIEGDKKPAPRFKTRVKMLWDEQYFYIGAQIEEPQVWATLTQRDSVIFYDNDFEVFIDPDGDNHNYYEFELNALNTIWDLRLPIPYRDGGGAINEWDVLDIKTAIHVDGVLNDARVTDKGWSVEMAIPWRALGEFAKCSAPPRDGDQWRVNFSRVEWDIETKGEKISKIPNQPEHNWVWSPQGVIDMHQPERWGYVQFCTSRDATFRPDESAMAREFLMSAYHAQRGFKDRTGAFAATLAELGVAEPDSLIEPRMTVTGDDFTVSASFVERGMERPDGARSKGVLRRLNVRGDSLLWFE